MHRHKPCALRLQLQRRRRLQQVLLLLLPWQGSPVVQKVSQESSLGFTCSRHHQLLLLLAQTNALLPLLLLLMWVVGMV